jgi:hypothetical protein
LQNTKARSRWQPPVDADDDAGETIGECDFADACFDHSEDDSGENAVQLEQRPQAVGLQLVEVPKMAQRLDIGFARKAKRVDVKALKENLWSNLAPDGKNSSSTTFTSNALTPPCMRTECSSHLSRHHVQGTCCLRCQVRGCFGAILLYLPAASLQ